MNIRNNSNNKFPCKCNILNLELLSIFLKYKGKKDILIPLLTEIQSRFGTITEETLFCINEYLNISEGEIQKTLNSHKEFKITPVKQHLIRVCKGVICKIYGSDKILKTASNKLEIAPGVSTEDSKFKLEVVECTGLCELAPIMAIDNTFYGKIDENDTEALIAHAKKKTMPDKHNY